MIVVIGEALIDLAVDGSGGVRAHAGGGPFNVSRTIARLGQPVAYLGAISTDRFGRQLAALLEADGVSTTSVVGTELPTTLALAELDEDGTASYRFYIEGTSAPSVSPDQARARIPAGVRALHVGTLGLVLEPLADAVAAVVDDLAGSALVLLDPNCRPAVVADRARFLARLATLARRAQVLKLSEPDLDYIAPGTPPVEAARALIGPGRIALLTRGGEGATVVTPEQAIEVAAPAVEVVDTIGAGDAFGGAFLAWWVEHGLAAASLGELEPVVEATRFACLVAAKTCERAGADPPWRAALHA